MFNDNRMPTMKQCSKGNLEPKLQTITATVVLSLDPENINAEHYPNDLFQHVSQFQFISLAKPNYYSLLNNSNPPR